MTIVHMVMFKFRPEVTDEHKATFVHELRKLKNLNCVKDHRLIVGGPSITDPIERSKGFEIALLSFHHDRQALDEYQASKEHHWVTQTYMFPFKEDLVRFDFEVQEEDEYMCNFDGAFQITDKIGVSTKLSSQQKGVDTPMESDKSDTEDIAR